MFFVIKKTKIIASIIIIAIVVAVVLTTIYATKTESVVAKERLLPIYSVETSENKVALSFDAAWGADKTLAILDELDKYGAKATFFLVGNWVDEYPQMVKEIDVRGHCIGNHSLTHKHFKYMSEIEMEEEIKKTNEKITAITGKEVKYFRAPFGEYSNTLIKLLEKENMQCIQWSVDSLDWKKYDAKTITNRILKQVKKGSIILCHNNSEHIVESLPTVLLGIKNKGLTCVRMDELVFEKDYKINNDGKQYSVTG